MPPSHRFGQWLDATMRTRGLSQAQVARVVGVADVQVSRWRRGQVTPSIHYLQRIADTFGVPRVRLELIAGYPGEDAAGIDDPELEAELEAFASNYRRIMTERVPPELRRAYMEACEALADRLSASYGDALSTLQTKTHHTIGFRTKE